MNIENLRKNYELFRLDRTDLKDNPFDQFALWFDEALKAHVLEPNAMVLATASVEGHPSCRTVLMKRFDENGIVFFTNYNSRKAKEIEAVLYACTTFFWKELERQVIIEGKVKKTSREESEKYFAMRPRKSQLSAWISPQGQVINSRQELESAFNALDVRFKDQLVPAPPFWGGFCIIPSRFEFWQGRPDRLHDRFCYTNESGKWRIDRIAP